MFMESAGGAGLSRSWPRGMLISALGLLVSLTSGIAVAEDQAPVQESRIFVQMGGYAHYTRDDKDERDGPPVVGAVEWLKPNRVYYGLSLFNNSFGQFSQFVYVGKEFPLPRLHRYLRARLSVGIVHGYDDGHEDDLPLSTGATAAAGIPCRSLDPAEDGYVHGISWRRRPVAMVAPGGC